MTLVIEALLHGKPVGAYFAAAKARWDRLLAGLDAARIRGLADELAVHQHGFEQDCEGHRALGQEIMVASGVGLLMEAQGGRAEALLEAFRRSRCSVETKSAARAIARLYDLEEATS
jgi:hypothetical protein